MTLPGYVEIHATVIWEGERVAAFEALPAQAWEDQKFRDHVKNALRYAIAQAIAERLDVTFTETESRY